MKTKTTETIAFGGAAVVAVAGTALYMATRTKSAPTEGAQPMRKTLATSLLEVILDFLPTSESILQEPDPRWDWVLGGRKSKDVWNYYHWIADPPAKYGTTCGIFVAACLSRAGYPPIMINRHPPEGGGYEERMHIAKLYTGAKNSNPPYLITVKQEFVPQPGDVYCQIRDTTWQGKPLSMEHVGIFLDVKKREDGAYDIETADGGQTAPSGRQCARRVPRVLRGQTLRAVKYGTDAKLVWVVRAPAIS